MEQEPLPPSRHEIVILKKKMYSWREEIVDHHEKSSFCYQSTPGPIQERILVGDEQEILSKFPLLECKK